MKSREGIDQMLWVLATEMPTLLLDANTFPREFEDRAMVIMSEAGPEDEDYVQGVLDALVQRSGFNSETGHEHIRLD